MKGPMFSAREALQYGLVKFREESRQCLFFLFAVEAVILLAAVNLSFHVTVLAQLVTQLESPPPDTFFYLFVPIYLLLRACAQVLVNKWLLLVSEGRQISGDEILGFDFGYHCTVIVRNLAASVMYALYTLVGTVVVVAPGVYVASILRFYKFLIVDRELDAVESLRESHILAGESKNELINLTVISLLLRCAGALCLGIGLIPVNAVCGLAEVFAYRRLLEPFDRQQAGESP